MTDSIASRQRGEKPGRLARATPLARLNSIAVGLPVLFLAAALVAALVGYYYSAVQVRRAAVEQTREQTASRLDYLQGAALQLLERGLRAELPALAATVTTQRDVQRLLIVAADGRVLASDHYGDIGRHWGTLAQEVFGQVVVAIPGQGAGQRISVAGSHVTGIAPLCAAHGELRPRACGFLLLQADALPEQRVAMASLRRQSLVLGATLAGLLLLIVALLHFRVSRRVGHLLAVMKRFGEGSRRVRVAPSVARAGDEIGYLGAELNRLITQLQAREADLAASEARQRAVFDAVSDAIVVVASDGAIAGVNPAACAMWGRRREEMVGLPVATLLVEPYASEYAALFARTDDDAKFGMVVDTREIIAVTRDGREFAADLAISVTHIDGQTLFTGVVRDAQQRIAMREALERVNEQLLSANKSLWQRASCDGLTGLANRRTFDETLASELRRAARQGSGLALLMIDVDYFKRYNDALGHTEGDECLRTLGRILNDCCQRSGELAARYGGEEFAVILPGADEQGALAMAQRIRRQLSESALVHPDSDSGDQVTVSVGAAVWHSQEDGSRVPDATEVVVCADTALYLAKDLGRNRVEVRTFGEQASQDNRAEGAVG